LLLMLNLIMVDTRSHQLYKNKFSARFCRLRGAEINWLQLLSVSLNTH
jgi:hypothetical protein